MRYRKLGNLEVSAVGLGCMGMSHAYGEPADKKDMTELPFQMAEEKNATPAQISLAWMVCKKPYIVSIPGTRKINRLTENAGAADLLLSQAEVARLDNALDKMHISVCLRRNNNQKIIMSNNFQESCYEQKNIYINLFRNNVVFRRECHG